MIVIYILVGFGILYGIAAILKHKSDKQEDEEMRAALHKFHRNMSNQEKYEALKKQYEILAKSLPGLEQSAKTIDHFAQNDRIKRNMKILLEEIEKLKQLLSD